MSGESHNQQFIRIDNSVFYNSIATDSLHAPAIEADKVVITSPPVAPTDAVNKQYVDSLFIGGVTGPSTTLNRSIAVWNSPNGGHIVDTLVTLDTNGNMSGVNTITLVPGGTVDGRDVAVDGSTLDAHVANLSNPHVTTKAQVGLGNVPNVLQNLTATVSPGFMDDSTQGYSVGSRWVDTATFDEYVCLDATMNAAEWKITTGSGGGGGLGNLNITGNTISSVNANGNINLIPNGSGQVTLKADPVAPLGAATKAYVDAATGKTTITLTSGVWTTLSSAIRGAGRVVLSVDTIDSFPLVCVDVGKNTAASSHFSEFRACNLVGNGGSTILLQWLASSGLQAQPSLSSANGNYTITVTGF